MPFTVSHVAFVLPLFRSRCLDPVGLAIGSMTPDFGYFIEAFPVAASIHGWPGCTTVGLPLAAAVWIVGRTFAPVLCHPLPEPCRSRLGNAWRRPLSIRGWLWLPLSFWIGILSHNAADFFTHSTGWMAQRIPGLMPPSALPRFLQHSGSLLGLLVLALALRKIHHGPMELEDRWRLRLLVILAACSGSLALAMLSWDWAQPVDPAKIRPLAFTWVVRVMAYFSCGYLALAVLGWGRNRSRTS